MIVNGNFEAKRRRKSWNSGRSRSSRLGTVPVHFQIPRRIINELILTDSVAKIKGLILVLDDKGRANGDRHSTHRICYRVLIGGRWVHALPGTCIDFCRPSRLVDLRQLLRRLIRTVRTSRNNGGHRFLPGEVRDARRVHPVPGPRVNRFLFLP